MTNVSRTPRLAMVAPDDVAPYSDFFYAREFAREHAARLRWHGDAWHARTREGQWREASEVLVMAAAIGTARRLFREACARVDAFDRASERGEPRGAKGGLDYSRACNERNETAGLQNAPRLRRIVQLARSLPELRRASAAA